MSGQLVRKGKIKHVCSGMPHPADAGWMAVWRCDVCGNYLISYENAWYPPGPFFYIGKLFRWLVNKFKLLLG